MVPSVLFGKSVRELSKFRTGNITPTPPSVLPWKAYMAVGDFLGANTFMDKFKGSHSKRN